MEENKVATHRDLRERAELVASANNAGTHGVYNCYSYPNLVNAIFRELVAVRDQAAICTGCGFPISKHPIHHEDETREVSCYLHGREA